MSAFAETNGVKATLNEYCKYNGKMADLIETLYKKIKAGETIPAIVEYVEEVSGKAIRV